ncbi:MAG: YafY family protein [Pseudomonadota bacterium]|nr:YafY family protein [Pseudomonadota bacterium]
MRRTERLFQIIQILRRTRRPVTATEIAAELETSVRTVYRDIAELTAQRVPVRGEAGIGYILDAGFDMPPLMLTPDEIEAAMLGAQWVAGQGDETLARAAQDFVAKVIAITPERLRPFLLEPAGSPATGCRQRPLDAIDMGALRAAIHAQGKVRLRYRAEDAAETERIVWPVAIGYFETVRIIAAWCELRGDFRHFRTDRVISADFLPERYPGRRSALRRQWSHSKMMQRQAAE